MALQSITLQADEQNQANAKQLKNWLNRCLENTDGFEALDPKPKIGITNLQSKEKSMVVDFHYNNKQKFCWKLCKSGIEAVSETFLGNRSGEHKATFRNVGAEAVLAEAVFFGR